VATSTYPPDQGPQAGEHGAVFCQADAVDGRLIVADVETGARSTSTAPVVAVGGTFPFILDFSRLDDASQRLQFPKTWATAACPLRSRIDGIPQARRPTVIPPLTVCQPCTLRRSFCEPAHRNTVIHRTASSG
jgi:hypothetical protein